MRASNLHAPPPAPGGRRICAAETLSRKDLPQKRTDKKEPLLPKGTKKRRGEKKERKKGGGAWCPLDSKCINHGPSPAIRRSLAVETVLPSLRKEGRGRAFGNFSQEESSEREDGLANLVRLSGPLTPQPVGDRSPKIVAGHARPPPPPRPQALLRRRGESGSATPRVLVVFLGTRCWEGAPEDGGDLQPGRRMVREVPPLQLTSLPHPPPSAASKLAV